MQAAGIVVTGKRACAKLHQNAPLLQSESQMCIAEENRTASIFQDEHYTKAYVRYRLWRLSAIDPVKDENASSQLRLFGAWKPGRFALVARVP